MMMIGKCFIKCRRCSFSYGARSIGKSIPISQFPDVIVVFPLNRVRFIWCRICPSGRRRRDIMGHRVLDLGVLDLPPHPLERHLHLLLVARYLVSNASVHDRPYTDRRPDMLSGEQRPPDSYLTQRRMTQRKGDPSNHAAVSHPLSL
jgi:hypothetical protein